MAMPEPMVVVLVVLYVLAGVHVSRLEVDLSRKMDHEEGGPHNGAAELGLLLGGAVWPLHAVLVLFIAVADAIARRRHPPT